VQINACRSTAPVNLALLYVLRAVSAGIGAAQAASGAATSSSSRRTCSGTRSTGQLGTQPWLDMMQLLLVLLPQPQLHGQVKQEGQL
jgi:hypothetical protein